MIIKELQERVEKKENQISKINKRIQKWEDNKSESNFIKEEAPYYSREPKTIKTMKQLIAARQAYDPSGNAEEFINRSFEDHIKYCNDEIRRATRDLEDAQAQLQKYLLQIEDLKKKEQTEKIPVIYTFLLNWKEDVIKAVTKNIEDLKAYYEADSEYTEWHNYEAWQIKDKEERKTKETEWRNKLKEMKSKVNPLTSQVYSRRYEDNINHEELNKILDKEIENKYWNLIEQVTKIVGDITDASNIRIGIDGNINGIIIGTKGKANLRTILAGGYNQDIIVNVKHGQILHARFIVTPIK